MKQYFQGLFIILAVFTLGSCQQSWELEVETRNSILMFVLPEKAAGQRVALQDFQVQKRDCATDCAVWSVRSGVDDSGELELWVIPDRTVVFGQSTPELETSVKPKDLTPGSYSAGGSISLYDDDGEFERSRILAVEFELDFDNEGSLVVRQ